MTPNPTPGELSPHEPNRQSGLANVFRNFGLRNRSGQSIPLASPALSSGEVNRTSQYLGESTIIKDEYALLEKLRKERPLQERILAAESLRALVPDLPAEFVSKIWFVAQDLVHLENSAEARQAAFKLFTACLKGFNEPTALERLRYYRTIAQHDHPEDFDDQLQAMIVLTDGGRNLSSFEKEIGGLLSKWLKMIFVEACKARQIRKREGRGGDAVSGAEFCLGELFKFAAAVIKFQFTTFEEEEINQLLSDILSICRKTTDKKDIENSIAIIDTLVTYGYIPGDSLRPCVEVLCGSNATIRDLALPTWNAVSNLCRSHMAAKCILTLRDILRKPKKRPMQTINTNTLRGAVHFLEKLILENGEDGLPKLSLSVAMPALKDSLSADNARLDHEVLCVVGHILGRPDIVADISFEEWTIPLEIIAHAALRTTERADGTPLSRLGVVTAPVFRTPEKDIGSAISQSLFQIISQLDELCRLPEFPYVEGVVELFLQVFPHIPDSAAEFVINFYNAEHLCYPSCPEWIENSRRLVDVFLKTGTRPSDMRIQVLSLLRDVYDTIREVCEEPLLHEPLLAALGGFQTETDGRVLEAMVKFVVDVAVDSNMEMFGRLVDTLVNYVRLELTSHHSSPVGSKSATPTPSPPARPIATTPSTYGSLVNIVTRGLVRIFIQNMNVNASKAARVYEELVRIAGSSVAEADGRLTAMRLLFRLRADSENAIFIIDNVEADYLGEVLNRTGRTLASGIDERSPVSSPIKEEDSSSSARSHRSASISQTALFKSTTSRGAVDRLDKSKAGDVLWTYPELRPLPEATSNESSPVLQTYYDPASRHQEGPALDPSITLRMSLWMEQVIRIVQQGCEWEVYSYVLCLLPSQLTNKTAFRNCRSHILYLRNIVCEQLHTNRMPSTALPTDIKRADIAVSLIHLLTVLVSFREHFAKSETEGIVKAFQLGLHSWNRTAKPCIHALSVCCYELPGSTTKFLSGILTKLSQIITSPVVSVHILEFLSALAKLPALYSNFTEPDFRNIFGIAFRYIQHARENAAQQSQRTSYHSRINNRDTPDSPRADTSDNPQYVLALAYNVLTTWFLSLRLSERPKYVSWIIRGLVMHDQSNSVDEQSEACMDMLQRFTYSEFDSKPPEKLDTNMGIVTKSWLNGMSVLTVQMMPETGVSRLTVRKPAGTSYYMVKPELPAVRTTKTVLPEIDDLSPPPRSDSDDNYGIVTALPSHILLQLGTGSTEDSKPILLPDDDKIRRALDVFDRVPVVDFHKIGVVYVGSGQTEEKDILSNAMGPPDYTEFIEGLGDLVTLKGTDINTGGLDRQDDIDGQFMYFWKDRTTEIAFHVTTMMPTSEHDPQCTLKKRHIGNDFVNIVFNNSGLPWQFGTIPSQFNFVSIIISPEARSNFISSRDFGNRPEDTSFYRVKVCCKEGFSDISPALEPKMVSAKSLPSFVRNLALNASVYSHVFNENGAEHISNVQHRLRQLKKIRERYGPTPTLAPGGMSPTTIGRQLSLNTASRRISAISTTTASTDYSASTRVNGDVDRDYDTEDLLANLDFSRYTYP